MGSKGFPLDSPAFPVHYRAQCCSPQIRTAAAELVRQPPFLLPRPTSHSQGQSTQVAGEGCWLTFMVCVPYSISSVKAFSWREKSFGVFTWDKPLQGLPLLKGLETQPQIPASPVLKAQLFQGHGHTKHCNFQSTNKDLYPWPSHSKPSGQA